MIGESGSGKTCLITLYSTGQFRGDHVPNVLDVFRGHTDIKGTPVEIEIIDTSGDPILGTHRQLLYNDVDCFLLCAAVSSNNRNEQHDELR